MSMRESIISRYQHYVDSAERSRIKEVKDRNILNARIAMWCYMDSANDDDISHWWSENGSHVERFDQLVTNQE